MNILDAVKYIERQSPCRHDSVDTDIGNGQIWAKCEECENIFLQSSLDSLRSASDKFCEAVETIKKSIHPCNHFSTCAINCCCYGECDEFEPIEKL